MSIISYHLDVDNSDTFKFKYNCGENYCLDFMPCNVKCLNVSLKVSLLFG